jgi:hypothetical protein
VCLQGPQCRAPSWAAASGPVHEVVGTLVVAARRPEQCPEYMASLCHLTTTERNIRRPLG